VLLVGSILLDLGWQLAKPRPAPATT
jgi:hypothetical protein